MKVFRFKLAILACVADSASLYAQHSQPDVFKALKIESAI